ncbi:hypothetical protein LZ32DRAFT_459529 [Colletotrichum eremochloae]|nr:hypothetical protein LZ32DRAFT_459529 [Colletotrichum eremochloae]
MNGPSLAAAAPPSPLPPPRNSVCNRRHGFQVSREAESSLEVVFFSSTFPLLVVVVTHSSKSGRQRPKKKLPTFTRAACGAGQMLRPELRRVASSSTHPWRLRRTSCHRPA